jgi:hypothetical protein
VIRFGQWLTDRAAAILEASAIARRKTGAEAARRKSAGSHQSRKTPARGRYQHVTAASDPPRIPEVAVDRLEVERMREDHHDSLFDVDPYDVLARPSESGFKTPFERDDASNINPQPRPT